MAWGPDDVRKWSTLALLAIMGTALTAAVNPGFVATISQKGLDFACHEGVVVLQKELEAIKIPDFSGVFKVKALGKGYYDFYSMAVDGFHIPNPKISLLPTEGLQLSIKDASIKISGRWASRKNFLKAKGMFSLSIQGVSFSADLRLGKSSSGHITVNCSACESHIKSIHIQISGSMLGWLIQLFHKKIETTLRNIIYKKVTEVLPKAEVRLSRLLQLFCSMLGGRGELLEKWKDFLSNKLSQFSGQYVFPCEPRCGEAARNDFSSHKAKICRIVTNSVSSKLQPYVQTIPVIARVDDVARIDYSLMALTTTAAFLQGQLKGEFFWRGHRGPLPITSPAMSFPLNNDHMVHLSISEYFFNSAGFAYQESGTLKITLRDQMLPKDSEFRLNTEFLGTFLPKVAMKFPSTEVQLLVTTSLPPRLTIQPSGLSLNPALETQAFAVLLNSSLVPLFLLHMNTNASMEVDAEGDRLVGELKIEKLALELKHSDFGSFKVELLQAAIDYLMPKMVVPRINERLRKGFPLPLPAGIKLNSLMFQSYQNFLVLRADVNRT